MNFFKEKIIQYLKEKIKNYLKSNPLLILFFVVGVIIGNYASFFLSWIPIIGSLFSFTFSLIGGIAGAYIYYKFKKRRKK